VTNIERMAAMALAMLDRALGVYATQDLEEARAVCNADDEVDAFCKQTFNVILSYAENCAYRFGNAFASGGARTERS
jgi:phosphate transport system protein